MLNIAKFFLVIVIAVFSIACSSDTGKPRPNLPIENAYKAVVATYNANISRENFQGAYDNAVELLNLDPSDTLAYLRLAIAVKNLNMNAEKIKSEYGVSVSQANNQELELKSLADALLSSKKN